MTKRRRHIGSLGGYNPFSFYTGMFNAGLQMAELFSSSARVIAHRTDMMAKAAKGELSPYHKEFTDMWMEKFSAGSESIAATMQHMANSRSGTPPCAAS